VKNCRIKRYLF